MKKICKKCRFFEGKTINHEKDTYDICHKISGQDLRDAFRWGEQTTCKDFESKEESLKSHKSAESLLN